MDDFENREMKYDIGDEVPTFSVPNSFSSNTTAEMKKGLIKSGSDWSGPKYKISWKARREMEMEKVSSNKNNPRIVELSKFPTTNQLPAPLPSGLRNDQIVEIVLLAQKDLTTKRSYAERLKRMLLSNECEKILKNAFWWFYIDLFKSGMGLRVQADVLYNQASNNFALLVMKQLSDSNLGPPTTSLDNFMQRYSSLLAQMVYSIFCWAYPQSQPKFDDSFREQILQTCTRWICGIQLSPGKAKNWNLTRLEPDDFRPSEGRKTTRNPEKESLLKEVERFKRKQRTAICFAETTPPPTVKEPTFQKSVEKLKNVNRMTMRRGTTAMGSLLKKKKAGIPQDVADSTSGLYHFRKSKFNLAGLSPFLENYLFSGARLEEGDCFIKTWQPLMDRIEIKGEIEKESLAKILYHSRVKLRGSIKSIDDSIKNEQRCMQGFQIESNRRKADMDHQINSIMKSKSQVHRFCDLYMLNATPKNPVPTEKILRSLNNKLLQLA